MHQLVRYIVVSNGEPIETMLPHCLRLSHEDFESIRRTGLQRKTKSVSCYYQESNDGTCAFGLIVNKKGTPLASKRNRIKRCFRVAFKIIESKNPKPIKSVWVVYSLPISFSQTEITELVRSVWKTLPETREHKI